MSSEIRDKAISLKSSGVDLTSRLALRPREAAEALVGLYLRRGEREQAIATLNDLRLRTQDWGLFQWIDRRSHEIVSD